MGNILGSHFIVACHHDDSDSCFFAILDGLFGLSTRGIFDSEYSQHREPTFLNFLQNIFFSIEGCSGDILRVDIFICNRDSSQPLFGHSVQL